jgi:hypothetical protein
MADFTEIWNPNHGDLGELMSKEEFCESVEDGTLSDGDGFANPAIQGSENYLYDPDVEILPSYLENPTDTLVEHLAQATHVIWLPAEDRFGK